ncbi:MAG TPA: TolC family protein [Candidatus Sulfotelmatobacter sp.]|nr:TolC family protein [Candidatus Sulfotelmatobacter sp.]
MKRKVAVVAAFASVLLVALRCKGQEQAPNDQRPKITFTEYVNQVLRSNLDLAAQRSNIAISKAAVTTASVRPDWSLDIGVPGADLSNQGFPTTWSFGLTVPIELGGKKGSRVRAATADLSSTTADYDDAVRQLRATAANGFVDALGARQILQSKTKSLAQLDRIVGVNEERLRVGDIGEIELAQSRVERDQFKADVISAESDVYSADLAAAQQLGNPDKLGPQMPVPSGSLEIATRTFDIDQLIAHALQNRSDVVSRIRAIKAADERIRLAKANLVPDVAVNGAFAHTGTGSGDFQQQPDNTIIGGVSVNLPISRNLHRGELDSARATRQQAELQLRSAQLKVEVEVRDAYEKYQSSVRQLNVFRSGLLRDADRVLEARLYAYQHGGSTLLEVIDAQRKSADVYLAYSQALMDHGHALVTLEEAASTWDLSF